jgi:hypothetical protein
VGTGQVVDGRCWLAGGLSTALLWVQPPAIAPQAFLQRTKALAYPIPRAPPTWGVLHVFVLSPCFAVPGAPTPRLERGGTGSVVYTHAQALRPGLDVVDGGCRTAPLSGDREYGQWNGIAVA